MTTTSPSQSATPPTTLDIPSGTVTFLFTDIQGSTKLWQAFPKAMQAAVARHDEIMRTAINSHRGHVFKTVGDAFYAAFSTAPAGVAAAIRSLHDLNIEKWPPEIGKIKVRMALHAGAPEVRGGDYFGPPLNRVARLLAIGHGQQLLLTRAAAELVRDVLPEAVQLRDLGEHRLKDVALPESVVQVVVPFLPSDFPPLLSVASHGESLSPSDEVVGVIVSEVARAYPMETLRRMSVVNDELGGRPIAVIYDPASRRVTIFNRMVGGKTYTLMLDPADNRYLTNEDRTIWWNQSGDPHTSLRSVPAGRLEKLLSLYQRWSAWKGIHPNTTVFSG